MHIYHASTSICNIVFISKSGRERTGLGWPRRQPAILVPREEKLYTRNLQPPNNARRGRVQRRLEPRWPLGHQLWRRRSRQGFLPKLKKGSLQLVWVGVGGLCQIRVECMMIRSAQSTKETRTCRNLSCARRNQQPFRALFISNMLVLCDRRVYTNVWMWHHYEVYSIVHAQSASHSLHFSTPLPPFSPLLNALL